MHGRPVACRYDGSFRRADGGVPSGAEKPRARARDGTEGEGCKKTRPAPRLSLRVHVRARAPGERVCFTPRLSRFRVPPLGRGRGDGAGFVSSCGRAPVRDDRCPDCDVAGELWL